VSDGSLIDGTDSVARPWLALLDIFWKHGGDEFWKYGGYERLHLDGEYIQNEIEEVVKSSSKMGTARSLLTLFGV
jgi:hypothetical protein